MATLISGSTNSKGESDAESGEGLCRTLRVGVMRILPSSSGVRPVRGAGETTGRRLALAMVQNTEQTSKNRNAGENETVHEETGHPKNNSKVSKRRSKGEKSRGRSKGETKQQLGEGVPLAETSEGGNHGARGR